MKTVGDATKIMAVVKMDGYGHGAVPIACDLEKKTTCGDLLQPHRMRV